MIFDGVNKCGGCAILESITFIDENMDGFCDVLFLKDSENGSWEENRPWNIMPDHPSKGNSERHRLDHNQLQTKRD